MAINPRQIGQSVEANLIYTLSKQLNNLTISVSAGIANVLAQSMSYTDNSIAQVLIYVDGELANKQDTLVSGVNIKTVNGNTILGPGDIIVSTDAITVVANYSALPPVATVIGDFFWVENSQGTQWLPGSLGGTYYPKGMYYSNGVTYEYTETPYQASQTEVNSGTNDSKFVTPLTLTNATVITNKVVSNSNIIGNTNTKITYDSKGLVTAGTNATTIDIADSINKRYQTDNQQLFNDVTSSIQTQLNNKQNNITGTTNRLLKFISANTVGNSTITDIGGNIGIGSVTSPGELLHIGDGNILLEGGNEVAQKFKRDFTTTGENGGVPTGSGTSVNPIFQIGRIIQAGDGDPEIRIMYSDDYAFERTVFEVDRKGIASSVKTGIGSHFEGFKSLTDVNPMFRLNSYPRMRLEMGEGGNSVTDVAVERNALGGLSIFTNNTERVKITSTGATTFTGDISATNLSGTNTGDETTTTIQSKRPLKTIEGQSLEGSGNIDLTKSDVGLSNVDNTSDVNKLVSTATQSALDLKVDKVTGKSLITDTEITRLATLANYTHPANHPPSIISQDASNRFVTDAEKTTWNAKQASLGYTAENAANKNTANGYAGLGSNGKLISSQLPDITISDTFVIASQVAMLAVIAQTGDVAVRTDLNKSFILKANDPTVLANWQELLTPTSAVTTVFGRNGAVTSNTGDYTADQITETATRVFQTPTQRANNDAISSIQTQLNNKQASGTYATGTGSATGTNTGDNATNTQYSGLVSNATHTGDATGATILTLATVNASVGTFGNATNVAQSTVNAKG